MKEDRTDREKGAYFCEQHGQGEEQTGRWMRRRSPFVFCPSLRREIHSIGRPRAVVVFLFCRKLKGMRVLAHYVFFAVPFPASHY